MNKSQIITIIFLITTNITTITNNSQENRINQLPNIQPQILYKKPIIKKPIIQPQILKKSIIEREYITNY